MKKISTGSSRKAAPFCVAKAPGNGGKEQRTWLVTAKKTAGKRGRPFEKGKSGNPSGRPKRTAEEQDALAAIRSLAPAAAETIRQQNFTLLPKRQIEITLEDERPVFSKIAYEHLGQNTSVRRALQNEMAQAVLLGESQKKITKRIARVTGMAEYQAQRVAQTERNRVQSQARAEALHEAAEMGISVTKTWSARMLNTRDSHAALNGKTVMEDEKFTTIWGNELAYPGDPSAPAAEVINCHCVLIHDVLLPGERLKTGGKVV